MDQELTIVETKEKLKGWYDNLIALMEAGFSEDQALKLVFMFMKDGMSGEEPK